MKLKILAVLIALLVAWPVAAYGLGNDKFQLWNDCKPVDLVVSLSIQDPLNDSTGTGLTEDRIRTAIESRLRAARIYTGSYFDLDADVDYNGGGILIVGLDSVGVGFSITILFAMPVYRPDIDEYGAGILWLDGVTGTSGILGDGSGFVLQSVTEQTDKFINEYLRVNAEACN